MKTLVFVPVYQSEKAIERVLEEIDKLNGCYEPDEILVIDDASGDKTFETAKKMEKKIKNLKVRKNKKNLGYGGNLKQGYNYGIKNGFDTLITLHGDGQHFPKDIPRLLKELEKDKETMIVLGTRFNNQLHKSGMPAYKKIGNRISSIVFNKIHGTELSEFHTGFRVHRLNSLKSLDYDSFSNEYVFDAQVLFRTLRENHKVSEVACPTVYNKTTRSISFAECCKYGIDLIICSLQINSDHYNL